MEGLLVVATSRWSGSASFVIESDSSNVVFWFLNSSAAPWTFQRIIREVVSCFGRHVFWSINYICRSGNKVADSLARVGVLGLNFINFI